MSAPERRRPSRVIPRRRRSSISRFGPCDIYGPKGGNASRTSFAFVANDTVPLYNRGCMDYWCSTQAWGNWVEGEPAAELMVEDAVCDERKE